MATAFERAAEAPRQAPPPTARRPAGRADPEQTQAVCHGPGRAADRRRARRRQDQDADPPDRVAARAGARRAAARSWRSPSASAPPPSCGCRLAELLGEQTAAQVSAATFHSICARLLRDHAQLFGRSANWTVYDQVEVRKVVDWLLSDRQRTAIQQALADFGQPASSEVLHEISLAKNRLLDPRELRAGRAASGRRR